MEGWLTRLCSSPLCFLTIKTPLEGQSESARATAGTTSGYMSILSPLRIFTGFRAFFRGLGFLFKRRLFAYMIPPSLLSLLLAVGLLFGLWQGALYLMDEVEHALHAYGAEDFGGFLRFFASLVAIVLGLLLYRFLAGLLVAPFLGPLLERIEEILLGRSIETSFTEDLRNALLGVRVTLFNMLISITVWLFTFWMGPFQFLVILFTEGFFLGRGSLEYLLEKETDDLKERGRLAGAYRPE